MATFSDPDSFFQTDVSLAQRARREAKAENSNGNPIRLPSKVLALIVDPTSAKRIYVSESGGNARRIDLDTRSTKHVYSGSSAPLPCLALSSSTHSILYAGGWDRTIYGWHTETRRPSLTIRNAHGDFVKCLAHALLPRPGATSSCISILISGGADKVVRIWNGDSGEQLSTLRGHSMGVLSIALDPVSPRYEQLENQPKVASSAETLTFLSASSDREIRQWLIQPRMVSESSSEFLLEASRLYFRAPQSEPQEALTPLPTSVNQILFFSRHESTSSEYPIAVCDLLACSASGGIALLSRACNWINNTIKLSHGEQNGVRALATSSDGMLVVSGGRDEDVWLWDLEEKERIGRWRGHADEIMGLGWLKGTDGEGLVVSASLDRTVRTWEVGKQQEGWIEGSEEIRLSEDKDERRGEATGMHEGGIRTKGLELTAEEEAELDELMEDE